MLPKNARVLPNGVVNFPVRGSPPSLVPGYFTKDDPFTWYPNLKPCKFRIIQEKPSQCCVTKKLNFCTKFETSNMGKCVGCEHNGT